MFDGKVPHWHHFSCFWLWGAVRSPSDISGFTDLRWDDQEKVKKAIESGGATGGDLLSLFDLKTDFVWLDMPYGCKAVRLKPLSLKLIH